MNRASFAAVGFGLLIVRSGAAQQTEQYEKVLLPVTAPGPVRGAFGSSWVTEAWLRNGAPSPVGILADPGCTFLPECPPGQPGSITPETSLRLSLGLPLEAGFPGSFLYVEKQYADQIAFGLRFRDVSRELQTWGTEIPVVREREFRSDRVTLLGVPVTPGFRHRLRIYELDGLHQREVRVRIRAYRIDSASVVPPPDSLLGENVFDLSFAPAQYPGTFYPAYLQISDLSRVAPLGDAQRIALVIEPVTPDLHLWAFVTVVNNETQHATVITPQ